VGGTCRLRYTVSGRVGSCRVLLWVDGMLGYRLYMSYEAIIQTFIGTGSVTVSGTVALD